ncbi:MAG: Rieske 2Fe-2S domain-containing protein [Desulfomonile tiedjei]|uniref:Rieske 2Fe-2S domain-containing protein n=1 Tax=Desulfomonile tiedjei TaxID=2358 RepID=A0A9D6Z1V8_9BACT|nr:Rieske 2Fe-2S domain-containing protein [Desulfomonile tiedjei]
MREPVSLDKRAFLKVVALWLFGAIGMFFAWGAVRFAFFSAGKTRVREFSSEVLHKMEPGVPLHLPEPAAWLLKNTDGTLVALDDRCTHLGCRQKWNPDRKLFECPCHGSEFDSEGSVKRGPATRPIEKLTVSVESDRIRLTAKPQGPS